MEKEIRPDHVAIYIRWSTEDQGDGTTLAVQSEACRHYLLSQGWQVRDDLIFIDDGHSGGSLDRPALTRLRRAVASGQVDCVVVFRLDRLSRSVIDTVMLVLQEWADLTHVKSAREPVDTTTAMGRQFFYMLVSYAEWERSVIRERMFGGKLRRAKEGRNPGMPAAYGYRKSPTPGALEIDRDEAPAVRLAFALAEQGASVRAIARRLTGHGYPTRKGGPWGSSLLSKLLRNPLYAGTLVWGRRRLNPRHGKAPGEPRLKAAEPHAVVPRAAAIPALVSPEQFARVQQALDARRRLAPGAAGSAHLLTGVLCCGRCSRPMQFNGHSRWRYYRCAQKADGGPCRAPSIPAGALEQAIAREVAARYGAAVAEAAAARCDQDRRELEARSREEAAARDAALARLAAQDRRVNQDYRQGRITADERQQFLAEIGAERDRLAATGAERDRHTAARPMQKGPGPTVPDPSSTSDPWLALDPAERKTIIRALVASVHAARTGDGNLEVTITWVTGEDAPAPTAPPEPPAPAPAGGSR